VIQKSDPRFRTIATRFSGAQNPPRERSITGLYLISDGGAVAKKLESAFKVMRSVLPMKKIKPDSQ